MNTLLYETTYVTSDLGLACALSLFLPIENIQKEEGNPRKAHFIFKKSKELEELIASYWRGDLKVNPQSYYNQTRSLKARVAEET